MLVNFEHSNINIQYRCVNLDDNNPKLTYICTDAIYVAKFDNYSRIMQMQCRNIGDKNGLITWNNLTF
jgi:hypothetical protein